MKTARQVATERFWENSQRALSGDPFAKLNLQLLATCYAQSVEPLSNAATRTLIAEAMRK